VQHSISSGEYTEELVYQFSNQSAEWKLDEVLAYTYRSDCRRRAEDGLDISVLQYGQRERAALAVDLSRLQCIYRASNRGSATLHLLKSSYTSDLPCKCVQQHGFAEVWLRCIRRMSVGDIAEGVADGCV
jgi:hypothetical protein